MLISFIIPVYNRADILHETMDSVLQSPWKDYEIILVNNGSQDNSGALCDSYAEQYSQVHVRHLSENQGPGGARSIGMHLAQGEWVFFLDSDDLICTENLEKVGTKVKEMPVDVDMIALDMVDEYDDVRWDFHYYEKNEILSCIEFLRKHPHRIHSQLWNYMFRRTMLQNNHIDFAINHLYEDNMFVHDTFRYVKTVACVPEYFCCYRRGRATNSIMTETHKNFPIQSFLYYMSKIHTDILYWDHINDVEKRDIYIKLLEEYSLVMLYMYPEVKDTYPEVKDFDIIKSFSLFDVEEFMFRVFLKIRNQFPYKSCYITVGGKIAKSLADYLEQKGCEVKGIIDNYAQNFVTPQGRSIPIYKRNELSKMDQEIPVLLTNYSILGDKMKKYLEQYGFCVVEWHSRNK